MHMQCTRMRTCVCASGLLVNVPRLCCDVDSTALWSLACVPRAAGQAGTHLHLHMQYGNTIIGAMYENACTPAPQRVSQGVCFTWVQYLSLSPRYWYLLASRMCSWPALAGGMPGNRSREPKTPSSNEPSAVNVRCYRGITRQLRRCCAVTVTSTNVVAVCTCCVR